MSRLGKIAVAVLAVILGTASFLLVLKFYDPAGQPGGSTGGSAGGQVPKGTGTATAGAGAEPGGGATAPPLPKGAKPLIRPGAAPPKIGKDGPPAVEVSVETDLFPDTTGDEADDSAIWHDDDRPEHSLVLVDNKSDNGGVGVYDLRGKQVHYERTGKIGNIDLRDDVRIGQRTVTLVAANDRSTNTLRLWSLDHARGTLAPLEAKPLRTLDNNYGFCLGLSPDHKHLYAIVTEEGTGPDESGGGKLEQYELRATAAGKLDAVKVRALNVGSQSEGCVVDDVTGSLYVAQEDVGIWRYDLDPGSGDKRSSIGKAGDGRLTKDVEGISATRGPDGKGVLVASSQGDSTFAVYDLDGGHAFRGSFQVRGNGKTDGATETDGLAVAAGNFGPDFPNGLLVVHDGENHGSDDQDERCSNVKFVRFDQVIALIPTR